MFDGKTIMITGGTGSFGRKCLQSLLERYKPKKIIIFSRDEMKQWEMAQEFSTNAIPCLRYFVGDVRDKERLYRAMSGVDYLFHAAALKIVPTAEYNPFEAIRTNIHGVENVISAAIDNGVKRAVLLSTDKAVSPANLYGATKLCAEKMFVAGNAYSGTKETMFGVVRYGNVVGSRGSVVPLFMKQRRQGKITITDERMTRFWITLEQGVDFAMTSMSMMKGGEVFVPKLPTMKITDLAEAMCPECEIEYIGIRPGEKIHELMISVDEGRQTLEYVDRYIIKPQYNFQQRLISNNGGRDVPENFEYSSGDNDWQLSKESLYGMLHEIDPNWNSVAMKEVV